MGRVAGVCLVLIFAYRKVVEILEEQAYLLFKVELHISKWPQRSKLSHIISLMSPIWRLEGSSQVETAMKYRKGPLRKKNHRKSNGNIVWNGYLVLLTDMSLCLAQSPAESRRSAAVRWVAGWTNGGGWDWHLNFVPDIRENDPIHVKTVWVCHCKHFLILMNHVFLFLILSIFYTNFLKMWTQLSLKLCLKWLIRVLLSQSRISWWVLISCPPSNMEHYVAPG